LKTGVGARTQNSAAHCCASRFFCGLAPTGNDANSQAGRASIWRPDARFRRTRSTRFLDKSRVGHDAPCPGVLWQVPARCEERRVGTLTVHLNSTSRKRELRWPPWQSRTAPPIRHEARCRSCSTWCAPMSAAARPGGDDGGAVAVVLAGLVGIVTSARTAAERSAAPPRRGDELARRVIG
jgi:hypothetical protein